MDSKVNLKEKVNLLEEVKVKSRRKQFTKPKIIRSMFREIDVDKIGYTAYPFSGEEIQSYSSIGVAEALVGRVPNYKLTDRGIILRSSRNNLALWDIDGMLFDGLPPFLGTETIESVLVVPSAAGAVMYGKRAEGGVIIVNTNRFGSFKEKGKNHPQLAENNTSLPNEEKQLFHRIKEIGKETDKLRLMAFSYQKQGNSKLALRINRMILSYNLDDVKSYRDVAESLIETNQIKKAWNTYMTYLEQSGEIIDKTSLGIIFNDMERLYHSYNLKKTIGNKFDSKINAKKNIGETRVVLEWTVPNETLSLEVINPKNQSLQFQLGSNSTEDNSIQELFLDESIKGIWKFNLSALEKN